MGSLHRKPTANNGLIHNITPEDADWRYVGLICTSCPLDSLQKVAQENGK